MAVVYLDRQHAGKPGRRSRDRGSAVDMDLSGAIEADELEAMLTAQYLLACELALIDAGHIVIPISDGWYSDRHSRVNQYAGTFSASQGPQIYVAAHLNAGWAGREGNGYGAIFYDQRSRRGPVLALEVARKLRPVAPELSEVKQIAAGPEGWTRPAYGTLSGVVQPVTICFEPAFMDCPAHADLLAAEGLRLIGRALAAGINRFADIA